MLYSLYATIESIVEALNDNFIFLEELQERLLIMNKKVPLFKYETFATHKATCVETIDLPRKRDR